MNTAPSHNRLGLAQALLACLFWGLMPVYFKMLQNVDAIEVVAHRIFWSVPLLLIILYFRGTLPNLKAAWTQPKVRYALLTSSVFIAANWLIYVWAVHANHILAASLGYFISPLVSIFMGRIILKEKMSRYKWLAIAIAALGVSILAVQAWDTLWISLVLAISWSSYALVRKIAVVGPVVGLTMETSLLFLPFALFLGWISFGAAPPTSGVHFGDVGYISLMLVGGAIVTAIPLTLFAAAVKTMQLSTIGLLQYLAPIIQFFVGVFIYNEPMTTAKLLCFALIWLALAIFSADTILAERRRRMAAPVI